jgi:hypothetical protein
VLPPDPSPPLSHVTSESVCPSGQLSSQLPTPAQVAGVVPAGQLGSGGGEHDGEGDSVADSLALRVPLGVGVASMVATALRVFAIVLAKSETFAAFGL